MKKIIRAFVVFLLLLTAGCAGLPPNTDREVTRAYTDTGDTKLGMASARLKEQRRGKSGFYLLSNGLDAFVARVLVADAAERSLDLQYYLYHNDLVGSMIAYSLLKAADRGVRVRVLLDDMGLAGRDLSIARLASHPNIQIRIFNPFSRNYFRTVQFLTRFGDVTRRMHNKSFTADNALTIVGGRNIGNEYFDADPAMAFGDLDVVAIGEAVSGVSDSFDEYWNSPLAYPIETLTGSAGDQEELDQLRPLWQEYMEEQKETEYHQALLNSNLANMLRDEKRVVYEWGEAVVVSDKPEKITSSIKARELHLAPQLEPAFDQLKEELIILTAYFVPGRKGVEFLKSLTAKGIRVRILTNSMASTDVPLVHAGYSKYRKALLQAGVELYEIKKKIFWNEKEKKREGRSFSKASLHAKAFIFDRKKLFIGSLNLDPRSFDQNTEIGIVFDSPKMADDLRRNFDRDIAEKSYTLSLDYDDDVGYDLLHWTTQEEGEEKVYTFEPGVSIWQKILLNFAFLLPIESQL